MANIKKGEQKWGFIYYELTAKGRKIATFWQQMARGSILGRFKKYSYSNGGIAILAYFRKWKSTPRSIKQIWDGLPFGYSHVTKKALLHGIGELKRKSIIRLIK